MWNSTVRKPSKINSRRVKGKACFPTSPPPLSRSVNMITLDGRDCCVLLGPLCRLYLFIHLSSSEYVLRTIPGSGDNGE